jgi:hypothetical protein
VLRPLCGVLLALSLAPTAQAAGGVERLGAFTGPASDAVKQALDPQGYRITLSNGTVAAEVWFGKDVPGLKPSAFMGVLSFPKASSDFRGQDIQAGAYTLRYALMPGDGNHLGAAPTSDFLLLTPLGADTDAAARPAFPDLAKLSARASGTNHPAPLNLADVSGQKEFPAVAANDHGHEVFFVKLKTSGGAELPIGLVVKGRTDH